MKEYQSSLCYMYMYDHRGFYLKTAPNRKTTASPVIVVSKTAHLVACLHKRELL